MIGSRLLRGVIFNIVYHLYAKPKLRRQDKPTVMGFTLSIPPGVFHPKLYFSSKFLGSFLQQLELRSLNVLDMGCGSGILSLIAGSRGATVESLDINPAAVEATRKNAETHRLSDVVSARMSDLFSAIDSDRQFDLIIFNPPFYKGIPRDTSEMAWKGGNDYEVIRRFFKEVGNHLSSAGKVICVLSSDMDIESILTIIHEAGLHAHPISKRRLLFETLWIYGAQKNS